MTVRFRGIDRLRRGRRVGVAIAAAVACAGSALAASGCGTSTVSNIVDPVAKAASLSNSAPGYRLTFSLRLGSSALPAAITATGTGSFDAPRHEGTVTTTMNLGSNPAITAALGGSKLTLVELVNGVTVYMKFPPALAGKLPGVTKPWIRIDLAKIASAAGLSGLSSLAGNPASSNPAEMLQYLRAVSGGVTRVGRARVGGLATTQYHGTISLDRYPQTVPPALRASARQTIQTIEKLTQLRELPVDVWVDGHNLVRRIRLSFDEKLPAGQQLNALYVITIPEYGPQSPPAFPPANQVSDLSSLVPSGG
jgi:hypothetical protein